MLERKEETKLVKTTLAKLGYQDVKVTHGRGTAWGWITVDLSVAKPDACSCEMSDTNPYPFYCNACKDAMHTNRVKVTDIILDTTGRRRGDYDGNTIVDIKKEEGMAIIEVDEEIQEDYLHRLNQCTCPWCKSSSVTFGVLSAGDSVYQPCECHACGKKWWDCYDLTSIMEVVHD